MGIYIGFEAVGKWFGLILVFKYALRTVPLSFLAVKPFILGSA